MCGGREVRERERDLEREWGGLESERGLEREWGGERERERERGIDCFFLCVFEFLSFASFSGRQKRETRRERERERERARERERGREKRVHAKYNLSFLGKTKRTAPLSLLLSLPLPPLLSPPQDVPPRPPSFSQQRPLEPLEPPQPESGHVLVGPRPPPPLCQVREDGPHQRRELEALARAARRDDDAAAAPRRRERVDDEAAVGRVGPRADLRGVEDAGSPPGGGGGRGGIP